MTEGKPLAVARDQLRYCFQSEDGGVEQNEGNDRTLKEGRFDKRAYTLSQRVRRYLCCYVHRLNGGSLVTARRMSLRDTSPISASCSSTTGTALRW